MVNGIRTDVAVRLMAPRALPLAWSPALARHWAVDCVAHVLIPVCGVHGDNEYIEAALDTARQYARSDTTDAVAEAQFVEIFAEEWSAHADSYWVVMSAAALTVARDETAQSEFGAERVRPGLWARDAVTLAREAMAMKAGEEGGDEAAAEAARQSELAWQAERLAHYLAGSAD